MMFKKYLLATGLLLAQTPVFGQQTAQIPDNWFHFKMDATASNSQKIVVDGARFRNVVSSATFKQELKFKTADGYTHVVQFHTVAAGNAIVPFANLVPLTLRSGGSVAIYIGCNGPAFTSGNTRTYRVTKVLENPFVAMNSGECHMFMFDLGT